jgi:hypothetical protein
MAALRIYRSEGGGNVMSDPDLLWTLFAIVAVNIAVLALAVVIVARQ